MKKINSNPFLGSLLLLVLLASSVQAAVIGSNPILNNSGGDYYIPYTPEKSGTLGEVLLPGGFVVGVDKETVIRNTKTASTGYVEFELAFNLSELLGSGATIDPDTALVQIALDNFYFDPQVHNVGSFIVAMQVGFIGNSGDTPSQWFTLDSTNYQALGLIGVPASGVAELLLAANLGVTAQQFEDMNVNESFYLLVKAFATLDQTTTKKVKWTHTSPVNTVVQFQPGSGIPEPATMTLMFFGAVGLLAKRRQD